MRSLIRYTSPRSSSLLPAFGFVGQSPWSGIESEIDRLFETALSGAASPGFENDFPVDVYEDKETTYVRAELPGVNRDDIKVEMVDGFLNIEASRKSLAAGGGGGETCAFCRSVSVPENVQADKVGAAYENGVLTVTLPKQEAAKPRKISVEVK